MKQKAIRSILGNIAWLFIFSLSITPAAAGSWWQVTASDTVGSGVWSSQPENAGFSSPHGNFSSSSNLCKSCHAVHDGGENSYRLLKDGSADETRTQGEGALTGKGNTRSTECMYCHDSTSGATSKKPYEMSPQGKTVRGEHTLGATAIPDSNLSLSNRDTLEGAVLQCYQCHSVHGANSIGTTNAVEGNSYNSSDAVENWNSKILRLDPAGDGSVLGKGAGGLSIAEWQGQLNGDGAAVRTGFCADCHNLNPNWEINTDDTTRPNSKSHPQGPGTDSLMEVYGTTKTVAAHPLERMGCRGCHYATNGQTGDSRFPHQSSGWKFLYDEATMSGGSGDLAGDPKRVIPGMDAVCLSCHAVFEDLQLVSGTGLCLNCHDSKYAAPDVGDQVRKASGMGIADISRDHAPEKGDAAAFSAPGNRHVECYDCHNAAAIYPWEDSPLKDMWGIKIVSESWNSAPTLAVADQVNGQAELCFKCHSTGAGWGAALPLSNYYISSSGVTLATENKAFAFNTKNSAFHPVRAPGRNQSNALGQQLAAAGLSTTSTIDCSDCHNADETSATTGRAGNDSFKPKGPHGSIYAPLLRGRYLTNATPATLPTGAYNSQNFKLCFICHNETKLTSSDSSDFATNFSNGATNLHWVHLKDISERGYGRNAACRACHYNVHSNQQAPDSQYMVWFSGGSSWTTATFPVNGFKTRLINFAPEVASPRSASEPRWGANVDAADHDTPDTLGVATLSQRQRQCNMICHINGDNVIMVRKYLPSATLDNDALNYAP